MAKTLKDLALALLNATLILLALCLFLAWKVVDRANDLTASFANNLRIVEPLRAEMSGVQDELQGLRADLEAVRTGSQTASSNALQQLELRVAAMDQKLETTREKAAALIDHPEILLDQFIDSAADALTRSVSDLRGCVPPS